MCSEYGKSQHALVMKIKSTMPLKLYKGFWNTTETFALRANLNGSSRHVLESFSFGRKRSSSFSIFCFEIEILNLNLTLQQNIMFKHGLENWLLIVSLPVVSCTQKSTHIFIKHCRENGGIYQTSGPVNLYRVCGLKIKISVSSWIFGPSKGHKGDGLDYITNSTGLCSLALAV